MTAKLINKIYNNLPIEVFDYIMEYVGKCTTPEYEDKICKIIKTEINASKIYRQRYIFYDLLFPSFKTFIDMQKYTNNIKKTFVQTFVLYELYYILFLCENNLQDDKFINKYEIISRDYTNNQLIKYSTEDIEMFIIQYLYSIYYNINYKHKFIIDYGDYRVYTNYTFGHLIIDLTEPDCGIDLFETNKNIQCFMNFDLDNIKYLHGYFDYEYYEFQIYNE